VMSFYPRPRAGGDSPQGTPMTPDRRFLPTPPRGRPLAGLRADMVQHLRAQPVHIRVVFSPTGHVAIERRAKSVDKGRQGRPGNHFPANAGTSRETSGRSSRFQTESSNAISNFPTRSDSVECPSPLLSGRPAW
jgi:hypothetical protein